MSINAIKLEADGITLEAFSTKDGDITVKIPDSDVVGEGVYLSPLTAKLFGLALVGLAEPEDE